MLELNLIPDVKLQLIKARKLKHLIIVLSTVLSAVSVGLTIFMFVYVKFIQVVEINNLDKNINAYSTSINKNTNLNKVLTIQNQLNALPTIESQTPTTSRIFNYLSELVPVNITISDIKVDLNQNTMDITGGADSLSTVNQFIDTLKYTNYEYASQPSKSAFSSIILSSFGYGTSNGGSGNTTPAQFDITFNFDPTIFNPRDSIKLVVPKLTTTRSVLNQPINLFKANTKLSTTSTLNNTKGN
jgi:Tfp pilus assembly protein PilN